MALKAALNGVDLSFALSGPVSGDAGLLKQGDLIANNAHLRLDTLAVNSDSAGLNATFKGALNAGSLASGDLNLDGATMSLDGIGHSDSASGQWGVTLTSDIASDHGQYRGLKAIAQAQAPGPPPTSPRSHRSRRLPILLYLHPCPPRRRRGRTPSWRSTGRSTVFRCASASSRSASTASIPPTARRRRSSTSA
ncbi:MAG: hypothetical protein WDN06_14970 [Asticcacaulis sp.]